MNLAALRRIERVDPARPDVVVGSVAATTPDEAARMVDAADGARHRWAATALDERVGLLIAAADRVLAQQDVLGLLLSRELGKVRADAEGEIGFAHAFVGHCARTAPGALAERQLDVGRGRLAVTALPYGAVAAITPWNAPIILTTLKVAPALLAGNTVVVKPSPLVPLAVSSYLAELAAELPHGVLSVANGGAEVGRAVVRHPAVRRVAFTGGGVAARALQSDLADGLVPSVLELGGNDPAIVLDDADLSDEAIERLVLGSFLTTGQVCMAAKRLYVHHSRLDELVERYLAVAATALVLGDPQGPETTVGPLASPTQRNHVLALLDDARRRGAGVVELGTVAEPDLVAGGWFVRPSLVLGLDDAAPLVAEEQFGPVVPLLAFRDVDEVVRRANASPFGLAASVWSTDEERAFALGRRLECGTVFVNAHNRGGMHLRAPFGGVKQSGFGRELGDGAVADWVQTRVIHRPPAAPARQYPTQGEP